MMLGREERRSPQGGLWLILVGCETLQTRLKNAHSDSTAISRLAGLEKWSRKSGFLCCGSSCISTTLFFKFRFSISIGLGVGRMRITGAMKRPHIQHSPDLWRPHHSEQPLAPLPATRGKPRGSARARALRPHPPTHAPGAPTLAVTVPAAAHAVACFGNAGSGRLRGARRGRSRRLDELSEDAAARGASPPSVHQSPDASEIRLWVCGERNATQTPFYRTPRK